MADLIDSNSMFYTALEPVVVNRFIVTLDGLPSFMVRSFDRPKLTQERKAIDYINLQRYYKGKTIWEPVTMELYDWVVPSTSQAVMEWIRLGHESVTGRCGYIEFYAKDLTLNVLGPVGDVISQWVGKSCFPTSVDFGKMEYNNDGDPVNITMTISANYWILNY